MPHLLATSFGPLLPVNLQPDSDVVLTLTLPGRGRYQERTFRVQQDTLKLTFVSSRPGDFHPYALS